MKFGIEWYNVKYDAFVYLCVILLELYRGKFSFYIIILCEKCISLNMNIYLDKNFM